MKKNGVKKAGILGILANLFLSLIKFIVGFQFKSQSMIADSFNSITDVFSSFMMFIGNKIGNVQKDEEHNFGHKKAEYIFSMFISISIFVISIKLMYDSIMSLITNQKVIFSIDLIIVTIFTILVKLGLYLYTKYLYQKEKSILLKSNNIDHRNDIILTTTVLIAIIFSKFNIFYVDSIVGIIISIWFLITGIKIFKESYDVLMDIAIDKETKEKITELILENDNIQKVEDVYSLSIGYKFIVVLTIYVDGNLTTKESHVIANDIEIAIKRKFKDIEDVFIHIHPF